MGGSPQSLSSQDIQDLQEVSSRLPLGHPMVAKINTLLNSQSTSAIPIDQFARNVRAKYPGSYDHLSDADLVQKVVTKYPVYKDSIAGYAPTQFEKDRPGGGTTGEIPNGGYKEPSMWTGAGSAAWDTLKKMVPADPTGGHSPLEKEFWFGKSGIDLKNSGIAQMGREAQGEYQRSRAAGSNPIAAGTSAGVAGLGSVLGVSNQREREQAERGESGPIIGEALPPAVMAAAPLAMEGVGRVLPSADRVGLALRTEKGKLKPGVRSMAGLGGGLVGHATGVPGGEIVGYAAGSGLADRIIPKRPFDIPTNGESIGAPLPSADEFYANRAEDLAKRGKEQAKLDTAHEKRLTAIEDARQKELAANERLKTMHGNDLMRRGADQEALDRQSPQSSIGEPIGKRNGVNILPEPREVLPGDKPGAMWSLGREDTLPQAARRGAPGAADVMRNIGEPILLLPREGIGWSGPRVATPESIGEPLAGGASTPPVETGGSIGDPVGPSPQEQYERALSDPSTTEEEKARAREIIRRLRSYR